MAIGYVALTVAYYNNAFGARDLVFMSTSLFASDGGTYNQTAILTPENTLDPSKLASVGLPRYTTTYVISQMCYNFSMGAAIVHVFLWNWKDLKAGMDLQAIGLTGRSLTLLLAIAFGGMKFLRNAQDIDDVHYKGTRHMLYRTH